MSDTGEYYRSYACPDADFVVVVECDGRVAFAYLLDEDEVVADVWLYNVQSASPQRSELQGQAPRNDAACVAPDLELSPPLQDEEDCRIEWTLNEYGAVSKADLSIRGRLYARLSPGVKPGWCLAAKIDSSLARTLTDAVAAT